MDTQHLRRGYGKREEEFKNLTKFQPQYTKSISNLQLHYIAAVKNTIDDMVSAQKALASNFVSNLNFSIVDEFVKKSNEINRLTINAINAAAENS